MKFKSEVQLEALNNAAIDTNQFLVSDGGIVKYRTGSGILSDLGIDPLVKAGVAINKGQAVYVTTADGTNIIVGKASNLTEAASSKTLGLLNASVLLNGMANVITNGLLEGLDTSTATIGDPVWLGEDGNLLYGLASKPYAPKHLVYIGVVTRVNLNNGEIFINVQNGFELNEIHDVDIKTVVPVNGDILGYNGTLWVNKTIATWLGYIPADDANVVHKTGVETIFDQKTFNGALNTTTSVFNLAAVDNFPTGGVPDAIRSYVKGHNGTSNSMVSCLYGLIENNKSAGIWIENQSTAPDSTNSIGFRSSFKSTSTGNDFFVGSRGATTAFRVNDYGDIYGTKTILGTTVDNTIDTLQVNGSARIVNIDPTGIGGITTKLLSYSADPYGLVFRAYATGEHSIQNQKESSDTTWYPLILQPLGGSLGVGTTTPVGRFNVFTGVSGNTQNVVSQQSGSISFSNGSAGSTIPTISGKSTNSSGLTFLAATGNTNSAADMFFNVRENDDTDFTTLTSSGFKFSRFGTTLIDILRNGNTTFSSSVGIGTTVNSAKLSIKGLAANESPSLGVELLTTATGTNWGGSNYTSGYSTSGTTSVLTSGFTPTIGTVYSLTFTFSGGATCQYSMGGSSSTGANYVNVIIVAKTTAPFTFNTTSSTGGTLTASIKAYVGSSATVEYLNSSGVLVNETRASSSDTNYFSGLGVGANNTTGTSNTGVGSLALDNNMSAAFNTALGYGALQYVTGAGYNVALGALAGTYISSPKTTIATYNLNSTFIGYRTSPLADSQSNQIVIGYDANGLGSNTTTIGNSTTVTAAIYGNLLLGGTSTVGAKLYVTGASLLNGNIFFSQPSPTAIVSTPTTLTIANILSGLLVGNNTIAMTFTLPTGTLSDAGILSGLMPVNNAFDWSLINTGTSAGAITIAVGTGHTIVGNAIVAISTSAMFRTRKTATNTFITYRIS